MYKKVVLFLCMVCVLSSCFSFTQEEPKDDVISVEVYDKDEKTIEVGTQGESINTGENLPSDTDKDQENIESEERKKLYVDICTALQGVSKEDILYIPLENIDQIYDSLGLPYGSEMYQLLSGETLPVPMQKEVERFLSQECNLYLR